MTLVNAPALLEYAAPSVATSRPRGRLAMLVLSLPAAVVPFLVFTFGTSPLEAASELTKLLSTGRQLEWVLALLGGGFFVALPVLMWRVLLVACDPGRRLRVAASVASLPGWVTMGGVVAVWLAELRNAQNGRDLVEGLRESWPFSMGVLIAALSLVLAWRLNRTGQRSNAVTALLAGPFLAIGGICLAGFFSDSDHGLGYYLTAFLCITWSLELMCAAFTAFVRRAA